MSASDVDIPFVSAAEVLAAAVVIPVVGILVVGLRFWQRSFQKAGIGADDYLILLALVCVATPQNVRHNALHLTQKQIYVVGMGSCLIYGTLNFLYKHCTLEAEYLNRG